MIDLKKLIEAGVHFGHQTWRWCPRMKPYIWGEKNSIHLIDVSKTARQMEKAAQFLESIAREGKPILWVGTKKPAQQSVFDVAQRLQNPYVNHRWIGGTLTNFPQVKKSVTKLLHYEDILAKAQDTFYTKKEMGLLQKMAERHRKNVGGITKLTWPIGALFVVDVKKEHTAIKEAAVAGVPIVAIVDTNSDPSLINYVIPANDDIVRSISMIMTYIADAVERGYAQAEKRPQDEGSAHRYDHASGEGVSSEEEEDKGRPRRGRSGGSRSRRTPSGNRPPARRQEGGPRPPAATVAPAASQATEPVQQAKVEEPAAGSAE